VDRGSATRLAKGMKFLHEPLRPPPSGSGVVLETGGASVFHRFARQRGRKISHTDPGRETRECYVKSRWRSAAAGTSVTLHGRTTSARSAVRCARTRSAVRLSWHRSTRLAEERRGAVLARGALTCTLPRALREMKFSTQ